MYISSTQFTIYMHIGLFLYINPSLSSSPVLRISVPIQPKVRQCRNNLNIRNENVAFNKLKKNFLSANLFIYEIAIINRY